MLIFFQKVFVIFPETSHEVLTVCIPSKHFSLEFVIQIKHGSTVSVTTAVSLKTRNSNTHPTPAYNFMYATPKRLTDRRRWLGSAACWQKPSGVFSLNQAEFVTQILYFSPAGWYSCFVACIYTNKNIAMHDQAKTVYHLIPLLLPELKHSSQQQNVDLGQANQASCTSQGLACTPANGKPNSAALKPTTDNAFSL